MKTEKEKIISLLNRTFDKGAWHGPSVKEVLASISPQQAHHRLNSSHSIIELVAHMISWRTYVIKRLEGDNAYNVAEENNFPQGTEWTKTLEQLDASQVSLVRAIEKFPPEKLSELVQGVTEKYTYYTLIHGIIHHDLYHIGQIKLISKATP
jgi:uncharacterized damage-inducible protein DinB